MSGSDLFDRAPEAIDGVRVGIGGWTYAPWRNNFYPTGLVQRRELEYASRRVSTIEINGTYYGTQKPATYAKWRNEARDSFIFSVKAPMRIMGARVLAKAGGQIDDFLGGIVELSDKLGPIVWQFDKGQRIDRDDFAAFIALLPVELDGRRLRHVLDVRDPDFVDADYLALVRSRGIATVFTDSLDYPSFADITADFVYARLMRSRSEIVTGYSDAELQHWTERARQWAAGDEPDDLPRIESDKRATKTRRDVFLYFISAAKERNPAAAMALLHKLGAN